MAITHVLTKSGKKLPVTLSQYRNLLHDVQERMTKTKNKGVAKRCSQVLKILKTH